MSIGNWCSDSIPDAPDITVNSTVITIANATALFQRDDFTMANSVDGFRFTLSKSPLDTKNVLVVKAGVIGVSSDNYSLADTALTLTEALVAGETLSVIYMAVQ